jgi:hypothetical protein
MLIEIAFAQDESFYMMGDTPRLIFGESRRCFHSAQIARKSAENLPRITSFSQIGT